jgi:LCP family protein required for cell wall assembly
VVPLAALWLWVDAHITHVTALSGAPATPGETYLIVGSDSRAGWANDGTLGARTDTIILLHQPVSGPVALISIPRDSYVEIPGHAKNKINAAFAFGGPTLLVQTVEKLTGMTIDHYIEVGFTGVRDVVDALGGVVLCYDKTVNDPLSTLVWTAGCHNADGTTALAFSRMRYSDPLGDIGRTERQQQLISAVSHKALRPSTLLNPFALVKEIDVGLKAFRVNDGTSALDLARAAQAFSAARGANAITGTPPIATIDNRVAGVGSTVLLDPAKSGSFWRNIANGTLPPGAVGGLR